MSVSMEKKRPRRPVGVVLLWAFWLSVRVSRGCRGSQKEQDEVDSLQSGVVKKRSALLPPCHALTITITIRQPHTQPKMLRAPATTRAARPAQQRRRRARAVTPATHDHRRLRPAVAVAAAANPAKTSLTHIDNAAAQSAAAIDVEYAHYELWAKDKRVAAASVPASVAVVARRGGEAGGDEDNANDNDWRSGLDVLFHAPYIAPSQEHLDKVKAESVGTSPASSSWQWSGGVRLTGDESAAISLATARRAVLDALIGRQVVVLHGAHGDLRALGLMEELENNAAVLIADTSALPSLVKPRSRAPASLQRLAREFLGGRRIQQQHEQLLHDPVEDAAACLDLWLDVAWPRVLLDRGDGEALVEALGCKMERERRREGRGTTAVE